MLKQNSAVKKIKQDVRRHVYIQGCLKHMFHTNNLS